MDMSDKIKRLVAYCPDTGQLLFKRASPILFENGTKTASHTCAVWNAKNAHKPALNVLRADGYRAGSILGKKFLAHRVAWLLSDGAWPDGEIDHINHMRSDNRFINLRDASRGENSRNLSAQMRRAGSSTGVYWYAATSRWVAKINVKGRGIHIGYFPTETEAIAARKGAEQKYDFHHNHGKAY